MQHRHTSRRFILLALPIVLLLFALGAYLLISSAVDISGVVGGGGEATLQLPPGFTADVFASGLNGPRFITFSPDGVLYVAERGADRIVALPDSDGDGTA